MNQYPAAGLASLVASQGRGGDSTLVHMTPDEVRSLQALARAQGRELPVNPVTGLPEASVLGDFLRSIGRGVLNVGKAIIQNPQTTALIAGTAYGAIKGDLQKGLEAGMKAYAGSKILGGIASTMQQAKAPTSGGIPRRGYQEAPRGADDYGEVAPGMEPVKPTVEQPLGKDVSGGVRGLIGSILGGGQPGTTQQGQGIFSGDKDPIMQAIALYAMQKAEQKATGQKPGIPAAQPVQYRNVQFSRGQVNPKFGQPGEPYFIGGGYTDQGYTTQYPGYTQNPPATTPQPGQPQNAPPPTQPARPPPYRGPLDDNQPQGGGLMMAGGGIVPRPNPSYPMIRVRNDNYQPNTGVYTGEETFAEGGEVESEEERRRKYFENLRPFAPALTDYYRTGAVSTGSDQGENLIERDPLTGLTQPTPGGIGSLNIADWYRSLLNPPTGRAPVNMGDYFNTSPYRAETQYGPVVNYPVPTPTPPPVTTAPPPPNICPPGTARAGQPYDPKDFLLGTDPCNPPSPTLPPETPFPPTPEPSLPPETPTPPSTPIPPTPEPSLPPETPRPPPPTPIPPTPEPSLPPETPTPPATPVPPITCQDLGYPPGWVFGPDGCEPPPETPAPPTPVPPTPEPSLPPETPTPPATPIPPTPEPSLPPETPRPPPTPPPPVTCQDLGYPPGWDFGPDGCEPPPETPAPTPIPPTPEPSLPPETSTPPATPIPPTPEPTLPPETPRPPPPTPFPPVTCQDIGYPPGWVFGPDGCEPPVETPAPTEPPEETQPPDETPDPDTGQCRSGWYYSKLLRICVPYPRQGLCPKGWTFDLLRGCVKSFDPTTGDPAPGWPGTTFPPTLPPPIKGIPNCGKGFVVGPTGEGCIPQDMEIIEVGAPNQCPNGYSQQGVVKDEATGMDRYFCGKMPDLTSEREMQQKLDCINSGGIYNPVSKECEYPEDTGRRGQGGGGGGREGGGGGGGGTYTPGGGPGSGGGGGCRLVTGPDGVQEVVCTTKRNAEGGVIEDLDRYMKKPKKRKKYQTGGIASLTRTPQGAAVNPADGYNFGFAGGGMAAMPEYRAGGKLLRGAGDGMSDSIPAVIRGKGVQRAALADGEFVIPADVVSHLGNGSTEAGAKKLYQMMAQIRKARTGKSKQAPAVKVDKYLPR